MVLGVCSAAGVVRDPLIIYNDKNMQSSSYGGKTLPHTYYRKSENNNSFKKLKLGFRYFCIDTTPMKKTLIFVTESVWNRAKVYREKIQP